VLGNLLSLQKFDALQIQRILYWIIQIIAWFGLAILLALINKSNGVVVDGVRALLLLFFALFGMSLSHALRFLYLKFNILNGKALLVFIFILLSSICFALVFQFLYDGFGLVLLNRAFEWSLFFSEAAIMTTLFGTWSIIYFLNHYFRKIRISEIENIKLSAQKQHVELALMRSQLNPHFLFNSLNSIKALISENPEYAKTGITKLSNILRSILINSKRPLITIEEEMQFVSDYLELEKMRYEERLQFESFIDEASKNVEIPPMTIQSLVENAVKHGISELKLGGKIVVRIQNEIDSIIILVINDGDLKSKTDTGVGLQNTKSRLQSAFSTGVIFSIEQIDKLVFAKIILKHESINR